MFRALDYINYRNLELNYQKDPEEEESDNYNPTGLQEICCEVLNDTANIFSGNPALLLDAVKVEILFLFFFIIIIIIFQNI